MAARMQHTSPNATAAFPRAFNKVVGAAHVDATTTECFKMTDGKGNIHFDMSQPKAANMNEQGGAPGRKTEDAAIVGSSSNQDSERDDPSTRKE